MKLGSVPCLVISLTAARYFMAWGNFRIQMNLAELNLFVYFIKRNRIGSVLNSEREIIPFASMDFRIESLFVLSIE